MKNKSKQQSVNTVPADGSRQKHISYQKNNYSKCVRENVIKTYKRFKTKKKLKIQILNKLSNIINKHSIGLHRNDCVGIFDKLSSPKIAQSKKKISKFPKTAYFQ